MNLMLPMIKSSWFGCMVGSFIVIRPSRRKRNRVVLPALSSPRNNKLAFYGIGLRGEGWAKNVLVVCATQNVCREGRPRA